MSSVGPIVPVLRHGRKTGVVSRNRAVLDLQGSEELFQVIGFVPADLAGIMLTEIVTDGFHGLVDFAGGAREEGWPDGFRAGLWNRGSLDTVRGEPQGSGPGLPTEQEMLVVGDSLNSRVVQQIDVLDRPGCTDRRHIALPHGMWRTEHQVVKTPQPGGQPAVKPNDPRIAATDVAARFPEDVVVARVIGALQHNAPVVAGTEIARDCGADG